MPTHFIRHVLVSSLVFGSFGTLADAAVATDVVEIPYSCTVPWVGTDRCGPVNQNLHIGPGKRLSIYVDKISDVDACLTFFVIHAVSGKQLASVDKICDPGQGVYPTWANPKNETLDVYVTVKSSVPFDVTIDGRYAIDKP